MNQLLPKTLAKCNVAGAIICSCQLLGMYHVRALSRIMYWLSVCSDVQLVQYPLLNYIVKKFTVGRKRPEKDFAVGSVETCERSQLVFDNNDCFY